MICTSRDARRSSSRAATSSPRPRARAPTTRPRPRRRMRRPRRVTVRATIGAELRPRSAGPFYTSAPPDAVDVPRTHRQQQVALAQFVAQEGLRGGVRAHPGDALAAAGVGGRLGDEQAGHAREVLRALARRDRRRAPRRGRRAASARPNARRLALRARVQVRLKAGDDAARVRACARPRSSPAPRSGGGRSRRPRARRARSCRGARSAGRRPRSSQRRGRGRHVGAGELDRGQRGRGVERVVGAGDGERHGDAVEVEARAAARQLRLGRRRPSGRRPGARGPAGRPAARASARNARNVLVDVALGGVGRVVVELGVGDDRDRRARA